MNTIAVIILNLVFTFNAFVCNGAVKEGKDNDPLSDARPEKFSISYYSGGGMVYYGETGYISADSCTYEINDGGAKSKIYFMLSADELDKLYKVFKDNDFNRIKTYEQEVYDRGGESISLSWGSGKYANISDGGMTFIKENWTHEWSACLNAVKNIISAQMEKQKKDYDIRFDKSFSGKQINLSSEHQTFYSGDALVEGNYNVDYVYKPVKFIPGEHFLQLSWDGKHYERFSINTDNTIGVILSLKNDSLLAYSYIPKIKN